MASIPTVMALVMTAVLVAVVPQVTMILGILFGLSFCLGLTLLAGRPLVWRSWHAMAEVTVKQEDYTSREGLIIGSGFAWTVRHAAAIHDFLDREWVLPLATTDTRGQGEVKGTPAFQAVGLSTAQWITIPWSDLSGHVCIEGATQSGKTYLLASLAEQLIVHLSRMDPGAVVILDPKGDAYMVQVVRSAAASVGRPFALIRPYDHLHSAFYLDAQKPFAYATGRFGWIAVRHMSTQRLMMRKR